MYISNIHKPALIQSLTTLLLQSKIFLNTTINSISLLSLLLITINDNNNHIIHLTKNNINIIKCDYKDSWIDIENEFLNKFILYIKYLYENARSESSDSTRFIWK